MRKTIPFTSILKTNELLNVPAFRKNDGNSEFVRFDVSNSNSGDKKP